MKLINFYQKALKIIAEYKPEPDETRLSALAARDYLKELETLPPHEDPKINLQVAFMSGWRAHRQYEEKKNER